MELILSFNLSFGFLMLHRCMMWPMNHVEAKLVFELHMTENVCVNILRWLTQHFQELAPAKSSKSWFNYHDMIVPSCLTTTLLDTRPHQ